MATQDPEALPGLPGLPSSLGLLACSSLLVGAASPSAPTIYPHCFHSASLWAAVRSQRVCYPSLRNMESTLMEGPCSPSLNGVPDTLFPGLETAHLACGKNQSPLPHHSRPLTYFMLHL